jgi:hypothetical protein
MNDARYVLWIFESRTRQRHAHRQDILHIEARIHLPDRNEGSDQQSRRNQQHESQGRLACHEQRPRTIVPRAGASGVAVLLQRVAQICTRCLEGGNESKQETRQNRHDECK